jgi:glycerate kinase
MPTVLVAPDKFKGTLTAAQVAAAVSAGLLRARPELDVVSVPVADGGDGTLAAAVAAGFEPVEVTASGPTGEPVRAAYARRGATAVVELAEVSGLARLPGGLPAPLTASSRGTGDLVAAAIRDGCRHVVLGIGGSACTDGGAGLLQALGARVVDDDGEEVPPGGAALEGAAALDLSGLHPGLADVEVVVACDVDNPLLGERGAAAVYAPQKGADPADVALLEAGLTRWAELVATATGADRSGDPGAGAAGGVGFAALAVLGATLRPGIELLLELTGFHRALAGATLVVTGEGSLDSQTLHGKAPAGVAAAATAAGIPVVAVCGQLALDPGQLAAAGIAAAYPLTDESGDLSECLERPGPLLERLGGRIARDHLG